ncbi:MAG: hypothetical protein RR715_00240 [Comamonas sp.]
MTQHQDFYGDVGQVLQAQSVNQYTSVAQFPERRPESQLQAEFAQRTGIWCPRPARQWLEHLMEHHHFTGRELAASWKAGSIGWNADLDTKRINTPWLEAALAYGLVAMLGLCCLAMAVLHIWSGTNDDQRARAMVYGLCAIYLSIVWVAHRFTLWPRRVAQRVRRIPHA